MAAEYESDDDTAEEISQLIYHAQVMMIARGLTPADIGRYCRATMLRIAVPNKGSLSDPAIQLLFEAGYKQRRDPRELVLVDQRNDVEFFFLRPRDVAVYVGSGTVQAGITGRDLLLDSGADATEQLELGFGASTFRYAAPPGRHHERAGFARQARRDVLPVARRQPLEVLRRDRSCGAAGRRGRVLGALGRGRCRGRRRVYWLYLARRRLGDSGRADLEVGGDPDPRQRHQRSGDGGARGTLARRAHGAAVRAHGLRRAADKLEAAVAITPGYEAPTVTPLHGSDWNAVRVMVPRQRDQPRHGRPLRGGRARDPHYRVARGQGLDVSGRSGGATAQPDHRADACARAHDSSRYSRPTFTAMTRPVSGLSADDARSPTRGL